MELLMKSWSNTECIHRVFWSRITYLPLVYWSWDPCGPETCYNSNLFVYLHYTGPIFVIGSWLNRVDKTPDGDWFQIATFCKWGEEYDMIGWKDTSASPSIKQYRGAADCTSGGRTLWLGDPPLGLYGLLLCFLRFLTVENAASH